MQRPRIGITSNYARRGDPPNEQVYVAGAYVDAVYAAGGLPQPLPVLETHDDETLAALIEPLDGIVFTGGLDPSAERFGEQQHPQTRLVHPRREAFEFALFAYVDRLRVPALGICLGHQVAHIARGGRIVQHIERDAALPHYNPDDSSAYHPVTLHGPLRDLLATPEVTVCSRHHQVVTQEITGQNLQTVATSPDGYVEASADLRDGRFLVTVQWHPEDQREEASMARLFELLVEKSKQVSR